VEVGVAGAATTAPAAAPSVESSANATTASYAAAPRTPPAAVPATSAPAASAPLTGPLSELEHALLHKLAQAAAALESLPLGLSKAASSSAAQNGPVHAASVSGAHAVQELLGLSTQLLGVLREVRAAGR
jgi:hypothetical protein